MSQLKFNTMITVDPVYRKIIFTASEGDHVICTQEFPFECDLSEAYKQWFGDVLQQIIEDFKRSLLMDFMFGELKKQKLSSLYGEIKKEDEPDATDET